MAKIGDSIPITEIVKGQHIRFNGNPNVYLVVDHYDTLPMDGKYGQIISFRPKEHLGKGKYKYLSNCFTQSANLARNENPPTVTIVRKPKRIKRLDNKD